MKVCPICHAVAFDDATLCFGCMYRYDEDEGAGEGDGLNQMSENAPKAGACKNGPFPSNPAAAVSANAVPESVQRDVVQPTVFPPAFFIKMTPTMQESGAVSWTCSVAVAGA